MAAVLKDYLAAAGGAGFAWGTHDCMTFAGNWVAQACGRDPLAPWRGTYGSEVEARTIIEAASGLGALMHGALQAVGWAACNEARLGDVVCAKLPGHTDLLGGIVCAPGRVAFLSRRGVLMWPADIWMAWRG